MLVNRSRTTTHIHIYVSGQNQVGQQTNVTVNVTPPTPPASPWIDLAAVWQVLDSSFSACVEIFFRSLPCQPSEDEL